MMVTCGRHTTPMHSDGRGSLFCPACEYDDARAQEERPSVFDAKPYSFGNLDEMTFKYAIVVRGS